MTSFSCSEQSAIERTLKKTVIIITLLFLNTYFVISQNSSECFLFQISSIHLKNPKKGAIKNFPEELSCFKPFKKQLNTLLNIKGNQFCYVDSILKENKLPTSFGFLPLILSGYKSTHTTEFSSRGIWALSYITGLKKNLQMNSHIDQRMNDELATLAAVKQLKFLWKKYKSENWTLLAFITSPSYVSNIFKESKSDKWELAKDFIEIKYQQNIQLINWLNSLDLNAINGSYSTLNKNYKKFSFKEDILFDAIAQFKAIDFPQIKNKNPYLTGQKIPKGQPVVLKKEVGNFILKNQSKIVEFQDSMCDNLFLNEQTANQPSLYNVKYGDVLGQIAIDYKVSVGQIMKWNNLSSTMIYQGQKLKIFHMTINTNFKLYLYTVNEEKYFWEVALNEPKTTIKYICKLNPYQELKNNQKLKIIKK